VPTKEVFDHMLKTLNKDITPIDFPIGSKENYYLKSFAVMKLGDTEQIVRISSYNKFVRANGVEKAMFCPRIVHQDDLFDVMLECHLKIEHGRSEKTHAICASKYSNISMNICDLFVETCPECIRDKHTQTRKVKLEPILSETFNDRGQMDLIDMQATPDGEYKWILHYQDNLTKFSYLRALRQKSN
jgi:hypothetical protein